MILLHFPWLPPTANHAYFNLPGGGRALSKEGKKFKTETATYLTRNYPADLKMFQKNKPYGVYVTLYMPDLMNKGWPKKAAARYKKTDASNRIKLLEDVLSEIADTDDSQHLLVIAHKTFNPRAATKVLAWSLEEERFEDVLPYAYGLAR